MLTIRQQKILNLIVSIYGETQVPVGSKLLMENIKASSATIRNDMKALEDYGFLRKEHLSSGRIPSITGYKYFLENFLDPSVIDEEIFFKVMKAFDQDFYKVSDIFKTATELVASLTGYTSLTLGIAPKEQVLANFDIVVLDTHSALAVMTLSTGSVKTSQFVLPRSMTTDDLEKVSNIVRSRLLGKKVIDIHYALRTEIPQILARYFQVTDGILELFEHIFSTLYVEDIEVANKHKLFEFASNDQKFISMLSGEQLIIQELRGMLRSDDMRIIKLDDEYFENLTVIAQKFVIPYRGIGTLVLVAPIDIDYDKVVGSIELVAKVLSMKLADYYRYLDGNHYEVQR